MITNIKDNRKTYSKSDQLDFIIEPSYRDNDLLGARHFEPPQYNSDFICRELLGSTIEQAIDWASGFDCPVTLFIYDKLYDPEAHFDDFFNLKIPDGLNQI